MNNNRRITSVVGISLALIVLTLGFYLFKVRVTRAEGAVQTNLDRERITFPSQQTLTVLVDDFVPQPIQGEPRWFYNRLGGDRGELGTPGTRNVIWGQGTARANITSGTNNLSGVFTSLNHPIRENIPLNFSAIFPSQILPQYQGRVTEIRIQIEDGRGSFKVDLQASDSRFLWTERRMLSGGRQTFIFDLSVLSDVSDVRNLNWQVEGNAGDFVVVSRVELIVSLPQLTTPERAFLWNYAMLLSNWIPGTGLTRDRANFPAGDFDNVSASGLQAAAAVMAWRLGFISQPAAVEIANRTTAELLAMPRCHGLWPHFVKNRQIAPSTEWSSVDTVIAQVALIEARQALGLDTSAAEQLLKDIDWSALLLPDGSLSHGYSSDCTQRLVDGWKDFGTESWLVNFGYAAATGRVAMMDNTPPTFNGSGFIDELAWLLMTHPMKDSAGIEWPVFRQQAADSQLNYYPNHQLNSHRQCLGRLGLFGLSAVEVPNLSAVNPLQVYQAFGVGGRIPANDGTSLLGHGVISSHYPAMIASLRPNQASAFWSWLEQKGFTPLNNIESVMFIDESVCDGVTWNSLKGSWNLGLQTLGWSRQLAGNNHPLYQAVCANALLSNAYMTLSGNAARFEADVAPRAPGKDCSVSLTDWVQVGRFAAGLDIPSSGIEFQLTDCAPRATGGDGRIGITDWVQAGRYAAGLDPLQSAFGPTALGSTAQTTRLTRARNEVAASTPRAVRVLNTNIERGLRGTITIGLDAQGSENALSLSLDFDPSHLQFVSAAAGSGASGATLNVNSNLARKGRVGLSLILPPGQVIASGRHSIFVLTFDATSSGDAHGTKISFGAQPIPREIANANASLLFANYFPGMVTFLGTLAESITHAKTPQSD